MHICFLVRHFHALQMFGQRGKKEPPPRVAPPGGDYGKPSPPPPGSALSAPSSRHYRWLRRGGAGRPVVDVVASSVGARWRHHWGAQSVAAPELVVGAPGGVRGAVGSIPLLGL